MLTWKSLYKYGMGVVLCLGFLVVILAVVETQKISPDHRQDRVPASEVRSAQTTEENRHRPAETDTVVRPEVREVASPPENPEDMPRTETPPGTQPSVPTIIAPLRNAGDTAGLTATPKQEAPVPEVASDPVLQKFQQTDFYRTLLDNNLFAPLGTTNIVDAPSDYQLLATVLPDDNTVENRHEAVIRKTADNTTRGYRIGDHLDTETVLVEIHPKYIILEKNSERRTLRLDLNNLWLK